MDLLLRQLIEAIWGIWRWRWVGLGAAWAVGIAGAVVVFNIPDQYEASARVYVDTESILKPLMSGLTVQPNVEEEVAILSRTLISRPNVEKLIRMTDLDLKLKSPEEREKLVDRLARTLQIKSVGRENLYTISFHDRRSEKALQVVQSLLSVFVESSLGGKRKDSEQAKKFIEEQIAVYEKKLAEAENRVKEFRLKHLSFSAEGKDYFATMGGLSEQLSKAQIDLHATEQSRDALKRELAGEDPIFLAEPDGPGGPEVVIPELDARLDAMKKMLDELLRKYTEEHPDVVGTRRVIVDLEQQREKEIEARKKTPSANNKGTPVDRNPVYQQLKIELAEAEAQVASLRTRVASYDAQYQSLLAKARMVPEVEAELGQMNRDYEIQKQNYQSLVARRESASLSGEMETSTGIADFRVIDPPRVAPTPVGPNRIVLLSLALAAAIGLGLFASLAASQIRPTFHDSRAVRQATKRPFLGSVSLVLDRAAEAKRRRNMFAFFGGVGSLIGIYGAAIALLTLTTRSFLTM